MRSVDEITSQRRFRRLRAHGWLRDMVRETTLSPADLIWPIFVVDGTNVRQEVSALPGLYRLSPDLAAQEAKRAKSLGIPAIATFPFVEMGKRDNTGAHALDPNNVINHATKAIKDAAPEIGIITDPALDPFTDHGHDGIMKNGGVDNDITVELLAKIAVNQAQAGADIIAPSDMMDGRIGAIRDALDQNGHSSTPVMSYAAKFSSAFYGPYREAVGTDQTLKGDKKTYYLDPANGTEALREIEQDIAEGADMVMVKPGMPYLDIIAAAKSTFGLPTFAYQVSAEYAMIMAAGDNGWIDGERVMMESMLAFKRAGADGVLSYFAPGIAEILNS